jgi:hypothetical protein
VIRSAGDPADLELEGRTWRQAYRLLSAHRRPLLMPLAVTQLPATIIAAAAYFVLLWQAFPEVEFSGFPQLAEEPRNYVLSLLVIIGAWWLFALVGIAGTIVATEALSDGEILPLSKALDPGFTRLGGLLAIGAGFLTLFIATAIGLFVLLYVIWRFGLALQQYLLGGSGVYGAFGRSWLLLRGRMLRFAGMLISLVPLSAVMLAAGLLVAGLALLPLAPMEATRTTELAAASIAAMVIGIFAVPVSAYVAVATTLFYLNVRAEVDV